MTTRNPAPSSFRICRSEYIKMERSLRRLGLDVEAQASVATHFTQLHNGHLRLLPAACQPTGVALGCPLPQVGFGRHLGRIVGLFSRVLRSMGHQGASGVASVPEHLLHVTVVNRTHYRIQDVQALSAEEFACVRESVRRSEVNTISVIFQGLILTREGSLVVPGYPIDDSLFDLRRQLSDNNIAFSGKLPKVAHIKLGHLLAPLSNLELRELQLWISDASRHVLERVAFDTLYTPLGQIALQGTRR